MTDWTQHPIYMRLVAPMEPFARHSLLHDMEVSLARLGSCPGLTIRVNNFVERGVPYFAPADASYRAWAAKAAALWDELHLRNAYTLETTPA